MGFGRSEAHTICFTLCAAGFVGRLLAGTMTSCPVCTVIDKKGINWINAEVTCPVPGAPCPVHYAPFSAPGAVPRAPSPSTRFRPVHLCSEHAAAQLACVVLCVGVCYVCCVCFAARTGGSCGAGCLCG